MSIAANPPGIASINPLDRCCRAMALLIFKKIQLMFPCFHWSGTFQIHRLGLFSARRISSLILYTLVVTLRQVLFISKQNQHLFQHHVNGCLCISFPSFPTCPKKTSMKTTKIKSHDFFAWEVSLFCLVCFHPNVRTKASAAATIRPPGQLEKFAYTFLGTCRLQ